MIPQNPPGDTSLDSIYGSEERLHRFPTPDHYTSPSQNSRSTSKNWSSVDALERSLAVESTYTGPENRSLEIRESVAHLPGQAFFDWLSGVAAKNSRLPRFVRPPLFHTLDSVLLALVLIIIAGAALAKGGWVALASLPLLFLATGRSRKVAMTVQHQSSHEHLLEIAPHLLDFAARHCELYNSAKDAVKNFGREVDRSISIVSTIAFWIPSVDEYAESHALGHHNSKKVATPTDDDAQDFYRLGFTPGKTEREYWRILVGTLINPWWYLQGLKDRIVRAFSSHRSITLRFAAALSLVMIALLLRAGGAFAWGASAYLIVQFVGVPAAGLLQQVSEHLWGCYLDLIPAGFAGKRVELICQGRFNLDYYPPADSSGRLGKLSLWWARLLFYHLPVRLVILPGDLSAHPVHHLHCQDLEWTHPPTWTARAYQAEAERYRHCWSLGKAIQRSFRAMAAAIPF